MHISKQVFNIVCCCVLAATASMTVSVALYCAVYCKLV